MWGIELLRDGNRLKQHFARFRPGGPGGPYRNLATTDYIVLDFRTSAPGPKSGQSAYSHFSYSNELLSDPKLYYVVFEENYGGVRVLNNKCEQVDHFVLLDK